VYNIKKEYKARNAIKKFDDTLNEDQYQDEIYKFAYNYANKYKYKNIIDIGCGSGFKLFKYFSKFTTIGLDSPQTVEFLKNKYPNKYWLPFDIESKQKYKLKSCDLVLAIDVIEHLINPNLLLKFINNIKFNTCIISTPERDIIRGQNDNGPPINPFHIREWNSKEFKNYISNIFKIKLQNIVSGHEQFIVCEPKANKFL
jgi:2-polyprenyl-3-methyl-5-hydroxy-6-metoxy-1,4-benzoquinol methylase